MFNTKKQNGRSNYTGTVNFSTSGNTKSSGNAFADALLGNFRTYSEAQLDPIGYFHFQQLEAFVTDDWKHRRQPQHRGGTALHVSTTRPTPRATT